jgi:hypothetical protein
VVQRLAAEDDSPREGDIHVDFTFLPIPRAVEIYKIFTDRKEQEQPGSNPRGPRIWIKFPEGFVPPEAKEPVDHRKVMDSLSDEFLEGIIGAKPKGDPKGHRNVKVFRDRPNGNASAQLTDSASVKRN